MLPKTYARTFGCWPLSVFVTGSTPVEASFGTGCWDAAPSRGRHFRRTAEAVGARRLDEPSVDVPPIETLEAAEAAAVVARPFCFRLRPPECAPR